jgi:hypothetical protein
MSTYSDPTLISRAVTTGYNSSLKKLHEAKLRQNRAKRSSEPGFDQPSKKRKFEILSSPASPHSEDHDSPLQHIVAASPTHEQTDEYLNWERVEHDHHAKFEVPQKPKPNHFHVPRNPMLFARMTSDVKTIYDLQNVPPTMMEMATEADHQRTKPEEREAFALVFSAALALYEMKP